MGEEKENVTNNYTHYNGPHDVLGLGKIAKAIASFLCGVLTIGLIMFFALFCTGNFQSTLRILFQ
jgi:hypothetical protein